MYATSDNLMGRQVRYLDRLLMPQIGTIIDWKPHKSKADVMVLAVICTEESYNDNEYTYQDKLTGEIRTVLIDQFVNSDECELLEDTNEQ